MKGKEHKSSKKAPLRREDFLLTDKQREKAARKAARHAAKRVAEESPPPHPQASPPPPPPTPSPPTTETPRPSLLQATTSATDQDQPMSDATLVQMRENMEEQRRKQRITTLTRRREELLSLVAQGKLSKDEAEKAMLEEVDRNKKEILPLDDDDGDKTTADATHPPIVIGRGNLPNSRQTWTCRNPFEDTENVEEVGLQASKAPLKFMKLRVDKNYVLVS
jgi:hypothetical protein